MFNKKKYYYYVFTDSGLLAQIIDIMRFIYFCSANNFDFKIYSSDWNYKYKKGWEDYFLPIYNKKEIKGLRFKLINIFAFKLHYKSIRVKIINKISKLSLFKVIFNYFSKNIYPHNIKNIVLITNYYKLNYVRDANTLAKDFNGILLDIWKIKPEILNRIKNNMNINEDFVAIHIRRGDKVNVEDVFHDSLVYIKILKNIDTKLKTIFVMTDDYSAYEDLKTKLPNYNVITNANKNMKGHFQHKFNAIKGSEKKELIINFLTEIETARKSKFFIGSIRSNIFHIIYYFKSGKDCYDISDLKGDMF